MKRITTSASRLKAKMGEYMRAVRAGNEVVITDRDRPVARLVPYEERPARSRVEIAIPRDPAAPPPGRVKVRPVRLKGASALEWLLEDRRRR